MAADMLLDGNVKVSWVPTIANIAAPTAAELTAGVAWSPGSRRTGSTSPSTPR
jgi:hypothetical protein